MGKRAINFASLAILIFCLFAMAKKSERIRQLEKQVKALEQHLVERNHASKELGP